MLRLMPKLWSETIEEHRRAVRDAALDATETLVAERGLRSVTMAQIAEETGVGRATLYKYFPDVDAILVAWHERQIASHLRHLDEIAREQSDARKRLEAVLVAYAFIQHAHHDTQLAALLHRREHVAAAREHLKEFVRGLLLQAAESGELRADVPADELADYCLHALAAASRMPSSAAVRRLALVTLAGLGDARRREASKP
jgi:AcrR family transcriptional regulator